MKKLTYRIKFDLYWFNRKKPSKLPKIILSIILFLGIILGTSFIIPKIYLKIKNLPEFQVSLKNLSIRNSYLQDFVSEISPIDLNVSQSIFNTELSQQIALSYLKNPWVASVDRVSIEYPNRVHCRLQLRKPFILVYQENKYFLCDMVGIRLPNEFTKETRPDVFPILSGNDESLPEIGCLWKEASFCEAIKILQFIQKSLKGNISWDIYLEELPYESQKTIIFKNKQFIVIWGKSLDSHIPNISKQERILALSQFLEHPSQTAKEVDVRFGYCILREKDFLFPHLISF